MENYYIITGAPGSGKSSVLSVLQQLGYMTVAEPARAIIAEQRAIGGTGVYDRDPSLFKELMLSRAIDNYRRCQHIKQPVFFDRGIPDILAYSDCFNIPRAAEQQAAQQYAYHQTVFFTPSWREIYQNDADRRINYEQAKRFGDELRHIYEELAYRVVELPCVSPEERGEYILAMIQ